MTGGVTAMHVAGSRFKEFPLAYQQIIFDAEADHIHGDPIHAGCRHQSVLDSNAAGGEFYRHGRRSEDMLAAKQEELVDDLIADGQLPEDIRDQMHGLADKWTGIVEELGYTDDGELAGPR